MDYSFWIHALHFLSDFVIFYFSFTCKNMNITVHWAKSKFLVTYSTDCFPVFGEGRILIGAIEIGGIR